jgi:CRISPR/Cas system-associated endonuclease Cas1
MSGTVYIDAHGTRVSHADSRLVLKAPNGEEIGIAMEQVDSIIVCGNAHFSRDSIHVLLRLGVATVFGGGNGGYRGVRVGREARQVTRGTNQDFEIRWTSAVAGAWAVPDID